MTTFTFSTDKAEEAIRFSLEKRGILTPPTAQVGLLLDKTGSFKDEYQRRKVSPGVYEDSLVQQVLQRILPFALVFDPDRSLDLWTFHNEVKKRASVTERNWQGYIHNTGLDNVDNGDWGGTYYSPVQIEALRHYGFIRQGVSAKPSGIKAWGRSLFGSSPPAPAKEEWHASSSDGHPVILYMPTDGDCDRSDYAKTEAVIAKAAELGLNCYFMFVGIDNDGRQEFLFLHMLADKYPNCGMVSISDIRGAVEDGSFQELMLPVELTDWLKAKK